MKPSTKRILGRIAAAAAAIIGTLCVLFGLYLVWFLTLVADLFSVEPDRGPGLFFIGMGVAIIFVTIAVHLSTKPAPSTTADSDRALEPDSGPIPR